MLQVSTWSHCELPLRLTIELWPFKRLQNHKLTVDNSRRLINLGEELLHCLDSSTWYCEVMTFQTQLHPLRLRYDKPSLISNGYGFKQSHIGSPMWCRYYAIGGEQVHFAPFCKFQNIQAIEMAAWWVYSRVIRDASIQVALFVFTTSWEKHTVTTLAITSTSIQYD